jgi:very-short-patch-repair endonuclease
MECRPGCTCGRHKGHGGRECPPGCTCDRHASRVPTEAEHRACPLGCPCGKHKGWTLSASQRRRQSQAKLLPYGRTTGGTRCGQSQLQRRDTGAAYAAVLCPAGYVRELQVRCGPQWPADSRKLDFAHVESKTNIELDGPYHYHTKEEDAQRDSELRALGWRVIRIRHDQEEVQT